MWYVVIGMVDDKLEAHAVEGANQALNWDVKFRNAVYETVKFTNGSRFFSREQMMSMTDTART